MERARLKREREEAHRYTIIKVATLEDMKAQVGTEISFDLVDFSKVYFLLKTCRTTLSGVNKQGKTAVLALPSAKMLSMHSEGSRRVVKKQPILIFRR